MLDLKEQLLMENVADICMGTEEQYSADGELRQNVTPTDLFAMLVSTIVTRK